MRENDKLNELIAEIGRSVKSGKSIRPQLWNEFNSSSDRYYNAEPKGVGPQTYRPRRAEKLVRKNTNYACRFATASRGTNLVIKRAKHKGDIEKYFMAGEYAPDIKESSGPYSSFGRQAAYRRPLGGRKGANKTAPSYSMQGRWKPPKKISDGSFQPPLYSSIGTQLVAGFKTEGKVPFSSGRDRSFDALHAAAQAEDVTVGPQTYNPKLAITKPTAASYSMTARWSTS